MSTLRSPLSIYVVFHPDSEKSQKYADALHDWFRLVEDDGDSTEAGIPVWYRCALKKETLVPEIKWHQAALNAVVVLVDAPILLDGSWRKAIRNLVNDVEDDRGQTTRIYPAGLCAGAFGLRWLFDERQSLPSATARRLRRGLTESVIRDLRSAQETKDAGEGHQAVDLKTWAPKPLDVFVSHAKADGSHAAAQIRDDLAKFSQLKSWFDESDIAPGSGWQSPLRNAVTNTTAIVTIVSDIYPTRNWCAEEATLARFPRYLDSSSRGNVSVLTLQPTVAVTLPSTKWSRQLAQLAQVPQIGSPSGQEISPSTIERVVDRLLLETLLIFFYRAFAERLAKKHENIDAGHTRLVLLTWVPDSWTLGRVFDQLGASSVPEETESTREDRVPPLDEYTRRLIIAYPGRGLRSSEYRSRLQECKERFANRTLEVSLVSQERLQAVASETKAPQLPRGVRIALSGGGQPPDVAAAGLGLQHINDVMFRLSQRLLEAGAKLEYGGVLTDYSSVLTQGVIDAALGWYRLQTDKPVEPEDSPLTNYAAWPHHKHIEKDNETRLYSVCRFVRVDPENEKPPAADDYNRDNAEHARIAADALSAMRKKIATNCQVQIVFAGKVRNWLGWLPGILEEVTCALEVRNTVLIVGGFGGIAQKLADFLAGSADWPEEATMEFARKDEGFRRLCLASGAEAKAAERFRCARRELTLYREQLQGRADWPFDGVDRKKVKSLLAQASPAETIEGVLDILCTPPTSRVARVR